MLWDCFCINSSLKDQPTFEYDETGKITGYKTKVGADTVFPFSSDVTFTIESSCNVSASRTDYISGASGKAQLSANITVKNGTVMINSFSLSSYCWAANDENGKSTSKTAYTSKCTVKVS